MAGIHPVPVLPDGSQRIYHSVEKFTAEVELDESVIEWSLEDLGRLARLLADIRSDISYLEDLAAHVNSITHEAIDRDRTRTMQAVA